MVFCRTSLANGWRCSEETNEAIKSGVVSDKAKMALIVFATDNISHVPQFTNF
jgi:hypothetical protein